MKLSQLLLTTSAAVMVTQAAAASALRMSEYGVFLRNSPAVLNAGFHGAELWHRRAVDLAPKA